MRNEKRIGIIISLILVFALTISSIVNGIFEQKQTVEQFSKQEATNATTNNNVVNLQEKINDLEAKLKDIEAISNSTDANQNKTINDLYTQINNIKNEIQTIKSQISNLESKNSLQEKDLKNLENRLTSIENKQPVKQRVTLTQETFSRYLGVKVSFSDLTSVKPTTNGKYMNVCYVNFEFYPTKPGTEFDLGYISIQLNTSPLNNMIYGCGTFNLNSTSTEEYSHWYVSNAEKEVNLQIPADGYLKVSIQIYQPQNNFYNILPVQFNDEMYTIGILAVAEHYMN